MIFSNLLDKNLDLPDFNKKMAYLHTHEIVFIPHLR